METFKRTLSFRKKKRKDANGGTTVEKPIHWQDDERKVREGTCSFQVKYLGCIEVFESRGMQVCEEVIKALKASSKKKFQRAILYVNGDALRVVDELSKGLTVDQTIEKVSFCAPDRNHANGFGYICRDGATRRWMCHGFLAVKESGERLSHAVGCAFAICLEKKQKRDRESVQVTFNEQGTSFTRQGSFRQTTLTERQQDPQSAIIAEPLPTIAEVSSSAATKESNTAPVNSVPRPRASVSMLDRQASMRLFPKLQESSPFKKSLSLRLPGQTGITGHKQLQSSSNVPADFTPPVSSAISNEDQITQLARNISAQMTFTNDQYSNQTTSMHFPLPNSNLGITNTSGLNDRLPGNTGAEVQGTAATLDLFGNFPGNKPERNYPFSNAPPMSSTLSYSSQQQHALGVIRPMTQQQLFFNNQAQYSSFPQQFQSSFPSNTSWQQQQFSARSTQVPTMSVTPLSVPNTSSITVDPFDVSWTAKHTNRAPGPSNPFANNQSLSSAFPAQTHGSVAFANNSYSPTIISAKGN